MRKISHVTSVTATILTFLTTHAAADFVELVSSANIHPVNRSANAWADIDRDGDLDLVVCGDDGLKKITKIYRNANTQFTDIQANIIGVNKGAVAWGDYDGDGDPDLAISGETEDAANRRITRIYRNDNGTFADISAGMTGVADGCLSWVDFDNDGDLDLFVAGRPLSGDAVSTIYQNSGGSFAAADLSATGGGGPGAGLKIDPTRIDTSKLDPRERIGPAAPPILPLPGVTLCSADWADFDKDGDMDLLLTGTPGSGRMAAVFRNMGGKFSKLNLALDGISESGAVWIDFDKDGDMDILLIGGIQPNSAVRQLWRNDNGNFTKQDVQLPQHASRCRFSTGDCDNDGDPDLLIWGAHVDQAFSSVLANVNGNFTTVAATLPGPNYGPSVLLGAFNFVDCDKDGDLDVFVTGSIPLEHNRFTRLFINNASTANTPPTVPGELNAKVEGDTVTFTWSAASDSQTPAAALTYNLRVDGPQKMPAMSSDAGVRFIVAPGNCSQSRTWKLAGLKNGTYTWSVQAVDSGFMGGPFAKLPNGNFPTFKVSAAEIGGPKLERRDFPRPERDPSRPTLPEPQPRPGPRPSPQDPQPPPPRN